MPPAFPSEGSVLRLIIFGHLSVDVVDIKGDRKTKPGGGVYFAGMAARRLGIPNVFVVTKLRPQDRPVFENDFTSAGVDVLYLDSPESTQCENVYPTDNPEDRKQRMASLATPFTEADITTAMEYVKGKLSSAQAQPTKPVFTVGFVNALWHGEWPEELLKKVRSFVDYLVLDAQGFTRPIGPGGHIVAKQDWPRKRECLPWIDLLKIDTGEANVLVPESKEDLAAAGRALTGWGARCVLGTQTEGIVLTAVNETDSTQVNSETAKFGSWTMAGRTGRGDTATAAYFAARFVQRLSVKDAVEFAARVTTQKMQYPGPYAGGASPA